MTNRAWAGRLVLITIFIGSDRLLGDEIRFTNGDRITGKITGMADGKLTIESTMAGTITVDMANVATFSTDAPAELHLSDGTVLNQPVAVSETAGQIGTPGTETIAAQQIALTNIASINPVAPEVKWTGSIRAGAIMSRGNTNTDNISIGFDAVRESTKDRITFDGDYLFGRQKNSDTNEYETTTDNWNVGGKYDYFLTEKWYLFASARAEGDEIALLDLRFTPSAGVGYEWIDQDATHFSTEAGGAWVYEDFETGESDDHFAVRLAYHFDHRINERVSFIHNLEYLPSVEDLADFNLNADAGLRIGLTATFFNEIKVEWQHDSEPAEGATEDDLRWIIGLGWAF